MGSGTAPDGQFAIILSRELALDQITSGYPAVPRSRIIVRKTNTTCCAEICPSDGCPVWPYPTKPMHGQGQTPIIAAHGSFAVTSIAMQPGRTARHPA